MTDALGDRLKGYEALETSDCFLPNVPVYARIDGRCFSRFTKGMDRPFDENFHAIMVATTKHLVAETNAILGYTQSDEISLAWYTPKPGSQIYFNGRKFKMVSALAAQATVFFYRCAVAAWPDKTMNQMPTFDARVFQVPSLAELSNAFLWRQLDAFKNAVSMAASHYFSHKVLMGKNGAEKQEMLFQEHGINFNDYPASFKSGTFVRRQSVRRALTDEEKSRIPLDNQPPDGMVMRSEYNSFTLPKISTLEDPVATLFEIET